MAGLPPQEEKADGDSEDSSGDGQIRLNLYCVFNRWMYRIKPSVTHDPFHPRDPPNPRLLADFHDPRAAVATPTQLRWRPRDADKDADLDFVDGLYTVCGAGSSFLRHGFAVHMSLLLSLTCSLLNSTEPSFRLFTLFSSSSFTTSECLIDSAVCSCSCSCPLVPGANGLASARDFLSPTAWYEQAHRPGYVIVQKYGGELFTATQDFSPFNVVAWHGNYVPYKYDLSKFCPFNTVLFDHADPSVNTVLTAPTDKPGVALLDFVIFPPRWLVAENTFRPPYYHRNCMSEFMGLIYGVYEAKADGFLPGGASLHSCMTPHGPDTKTYEATISKLGGPEANTPTRLSGTLAFMFESALIPRVCRWALESPSRDLDYYQCWIGLKSHFSHGKDGSDGPATTSSDDKDGEK
uniref:Homogentisate 1,2-dioxygenase n=1 Tax=Aegilops tauschii TaxID=37682 RepID=R7VZG8_AEGTA